MRTQECSLAVIGCGNLGSAIVRGLCAAKTVKKIFVFDTHSEKLEELRSLGASPCQSLEDLPPEIDIVLIAVKPKVVVPVLRALRMQFGEAVKEKLFISVAAGLAFEHLCAALGRDVRIVRTMPNLPLTVGCGMTGIFSLHAEDAAIAETIFSAVGKAVIVDSEDQLDSITALSACGPGFMMFIIDAMIAGAVSTGLDRSVATLLAKEMVYGSGALARVLEKSPSEIQAMVATPGGTTMAGLTVLENLGVRKALISMIQASVARARELRNAGVEEK